MADSLTDKSDVLTMPSRTSDDSDLEKGSATKEQGQSLERAGPRPRWWHFVTDPKRRSETKEQESITRNLDECPLGYPRLAAFLSSDRSFMQYRGFGSLHARILLAQQYDIEQLEDELDGIDRWDERESGVMKLGSKRRDDLKCQVNEMPASYPTDRTRPEVLAELKQQLMCYDKMLLKAKDIVAMQRPSRRDWRSVKNWLINEKPLVPSESKFIRRKEDLVTLRVGREGAGFEGVVEQMLSRTDRFLTKRLKCRIIKRMFMTPELREKTSDQAVNYYAPERVDKLVNAIITAVIFVLLILPVVAMYQLSNVSQRASPFEAIGILIVFTLLFGMAMSSLTKATRQELFAASAAYCAVLVVFISNFSTQTVEIAQ